jgi:amino acid permease
MGVLLPSSFQTRVVIKGLHQRHIQMIALAGTVGTGIFLSSGRAIVEAGPLGELTGRILYFAIVAHFAVSVDWDIWVGHDGGSTATLAGTVGTGIFLSSGRAIVEAGPLGAFLAYTIIGATVVVNLLELTGRILYFAIVAHFAVSVDWDIWVGHDGGSQCHLL